MKVTITKINTDNMTNLPTPILEMSLIDPIRFKAFFKLPVCAYLASAIAWKNEKIRNMIKAAEIVMANEANNWNDAMDTAFS